MKAMQIVAVVICVVLNSLDGFDVLSISFASPGIAKEWGIDRAALGVVLSMELIGMAVGSIVLGSVCDRIGRKPMVLLCLVIMASGMFLASTAGSVTILSVYRLITGLGIGGMLAATNAIVAEFSNRKNKALAVALMAGGYPLGAIIGGSISTQILASTGNWRGIFIFGAICTAVMIPIVMLLMSESVGFLVARRPQNVVAKLNKTLKRIGQPEVTDLSANLTAAPKTKVTELFTGGLGLVTILLTLAYFFHIMTFYFTLKWVPKIVVDMGFEPASAGAVLVWANVGGLLGSIALSFLSLKIKTRTLVVGAMLLSVVAIIVFGRGQADLTQMSLLVAIAGFCTNAAVVGIYAIVAMSFPSALRAGGTGFVIGAGRGGAAVSPIVAGLLFQSGMGLQGVAIVMAMGSLLAVGCLFALRAKSAETHL